MKKQAWLILILLLVLAGLGGGLYFLREKPAEETVSETSADEAILSFTEEELNFIWVDNQEGGVTAEKTSDGWVIDGMEGVPVDSSALHTLVSSVMSLKPVREIEDGGTRLEEFGLTEETASAIVEAGYAENDRTRILVGDEVPGVDKKSRYVEKDGRVYVAYETKVGVFLNRPEDFVELEITPSTKASSETLQVQSVDITGTGYCAGMPLPLHVQLAENREVAGAALALYEITSPWEIPADPSAAVAWTESFLNLSAEEVATLHPNESDWAYFGLKEPGAVVTLTYSNNSGEISECAFSLSAPDPSGLFFASVPGRDVIYVVDVQNVDWVNRGLQDLVSRQLLTPSLAALSKVTITAQGLEPAVIELEQDAEAGSTRALLKGAELEDQSFRNFYYTLINQTADEVLFEETALPEEAEKVAEIRYTYAEDGREEVLSYFTESDRTLTVVKNDGERLFRMSTSKWNQVLETLGKLVSGEKVEARY